MSINSGPSNLSNNLVLSIDAYNEKSWKGRPTENFLVTSPSGIASCMGRSDKRPFYNNSHSSQGLLVSGNSYSSRIVPNKPVDEPCEIWHTTNSIPNNYSRFSPTSTINIDNDLDGYDIPYVVSSYIYIHQDVTLGTGNDCPVSQNNTGTDWHNSGSTTVATFNTTYSYWSYNSKTGGVVADRDLRRGWQRIYSTFVPSSTIRDQEVGVTINRLGGYFRPNLVDSDGSNYILVAASQLEKGTIPSPYVYGSRSNTESIIDLTGNRTVTVNSISDSADGLYYFDGTNSLTIPSIDFPNEQTIEIWLRPKEGDGARRNPYNQAYGGYGTWTHEPSGQINYYYGDGAGNLQPYVGHTSTFTVAQNELACVCTTRNTSQSIWFKNGVQYNSLNHSYGSLATHTTDITIGSGYAGAYIGDILSVKLWNRALTPAEVKASFESSRKRFGL